MTGLHIILGFLVLLSGSVGIAAPRLTCDAPVYFFGRQCATQQVSHVFRIANSGDEPLFIERLRKTCGCTEAALSGRHLAPGQSAEIRVQLSLQGQSGHVRKYVYVDSSDPVAPSLTLTLEGDSYKDMEIQPAVLHYGIVAPEETIERRVTVWSATQSFRITGITCASPALSFTADNNATGNSHQIAINLHGIEVRGALRESIEIQTDHPRQPVIRLPVLAVRRRPLLAVPAMLILDGQSVNACTSTVFLYSLDRKDFSIRQAEPPDPALRIEWKKEGIGRYRASIVCPPNPRSLSSGAVRIETDLPADGRLVEIPIHTEE